LILSKKILPALDNLRRAQQHLPKELENNDWAKGVLQVVNAAGKYPGRRRIGENSHQ